MNKKLTIPIVLGLILIAAIGILYINANGVPSLGDPCSPSNARKTTGPVEAIMREFDDYGTIASSQTREEITPTIEELQRVRRDMEDLQLPECAEGLRTAALNYMNEVINTTIAFMGGADTNIVSIGIQSARQQRRAYEGELFRLQGITATPAPIQAATAQP